VRKEFETVLDTFSKSMSKRLQEEAKIIDNADSRLRNLERELMKPWPRVYYRGKGVL
jgi:hypothetical protein